MKKYLLAGLLLLSLVCLFSACKDDKTGAPAKANTVQFTASGARVESSAEISVESLQTIDEALREVFSDAAALNYSNVLTHGEYKIYVHRECTDRNGVMNWLGEAPNYDQTEFDHDPRVGHTKVYRAEEVIRVNGAIVPRFIICLDTQPNMANTTRYGAEHVILFFNDRDLYYQTETHLTGGHPIIPFRTR